jgi:hypothetical protein
LGCLSQRIEIANGTSLEVNTVKLEARSIATGMEAIDRDESAILSDCMGLLHANARETARITPVIFVNFFRKVFIKYLLKTLMEVFWLINKYKIHKK